MREHAQLIRVSHPHLGSYEVDLVPVYPLPDATTEVDYYAYVLINNESEPLVSGERVVLKWVNSTQHGRGEITEVTEEPEEGSEATEWRTFKVSISMREQNLNLRHYPRLLGGLSLLYASLESITNPEAWLNEVVDHEAEVLEADPRFSAPLDSLMNFSVSGLSFESERALDTSHFLLCSLGLGGEEERVRCLAKVVRCHESDQHFNIALSFVSPPPKLTQKLSAFTLKLQRIETEGERDEI